MTGFQHDIAGGSGGLIIPSLHSPDYVPGVSGWAIFKNGNVEFNSGTFRGTISAGIFQGTNFVINPNGMFFYSPSEGAGNLIVSITPSAGSDDFGNPYGAGLNVGNQSGNHMGIDLLGRIFLFNSADQQLFELSGNNGEIIAKDDSGVIQAVFAAGSAPFGLVGPAAALVSGNPETWHDLRPLSNSFTAPAGDYPPQYRLNSFGEVEIWGAVTLPTTYAAVTFATLPAGYVPIAHTQRYPIAFQFSGAPTSARVQVGTSGALSLQGLPTGASGTSVWIGGKFPLDSTGLITA